MFLTKYRTRLFVSCWFSFFSPPLFSRLFYANRKIPERYNHLQVVGKGSYGVVCSAIDSVRNNAAVAIKKISPMAAHR